mmetsp:Transcript_21256/g.40350  ORF Transcript_21256/g.40350 Transcript_21256/m.40350 type:complete len:842 (-) Transcript_21256:73-2598(-)
MAESITREGEEYTAPSILGTARYLVDFPRREYSTDFAAFIAGDDEDVEVYKSGLLVLACILASIYVIWWMVLLVLKCKGKSVGCASGRSFRGERMESRPAGHDSGSTDLEDEWASGAEPSSRGDSGFADEVSFHSSIHSSEEQERSVSSDTDSSSEYSLVSRPTSRERRTQLAFFAFGLITLAVVPLALTMSFSPLKRALDSTEAYLLQSQSILSQVDNALNTIDVVINTTGGVIADAPWTTEALCPKRTFDEIKEAYGVDLDYVESVIVSEYERIRASIDTRLSDVISNTNSVEDLLHTVETAHRETETYLWVVPGLMLALTSVTASLLFGVMLAWKRQSNRHAQRTLTYFVLPCLICISLVCWVVGISSAISVAIFSDACTQGTQDGSPGVIVERIVSLQGFDQNTTTHEIVKAFTDGCQVDSNPTAYIESVGSQIQQIIDDLYQYISTIDAIGRNDLISICGSDSLNDMVKEAQDIATLLTSVRRALALLTSSLQCEDISPIYSGAVEDSACTDLATASSWSMFMFLLLGVSTMCMISLRASWRHKVGDEQIYNEDEVAENMFLDEHEEYLHYISKFKHEWEEYGGINSVVPVAPNRPHTMYDEASESEDSNGSRTMSQGLPVDDQAYSEVGDEGEGHEMRYISSYTVHQEAFNPYTAPASPSQSTDASEDISFLSLRSMQIRTPQNKDPESGVDVEAISTSGKNNGDDRDLFSRLGLLREAVQRFAIDFEVTSGNGRKNDIDTGTDQRVTQASSEIGKDDSSLGSLSKLRSTASEGGGLFKRGWRTRASISQQSADVSQQIWRREFSTSSTSQQQSDGANPLESPHLSTRAQSQYSL